ncbi:hypothetical protein D030_0115A, partial [Vibrio parahaemolyticus AQ3810]|jgi:hypothetical protein
MALF